MISIIKIIGKSMSPLYQEGDFVFIYKPFWGKVPKIKDKVIFNHSKYGLLIKEVTLVDQIKKGFLSKGLNKFTVSKEEIGLINFNQIKGFPFLHIKKKSNSINH